MTQLKCLLARHGFTIIILLLGSQPLFAMDCGKAVSPVDKAICADPAIAAADSAMGAAYSALYASDSDADKKQLLLSQRNWLKSRANACVDDRKPSATCLKEWTQRRSLFLQGKPESGPGTGHDLTPVIIAQAGTKTGYEQDIAAMKFRAPVLPGEQLFNTQINKLLKDAPSAKDADAEPDMTYTYDLTIRLAYASPRFLSASVESYVFEGGAHGNSGTSGINIDVAKGKLVEFDDVFQPPAAGKLSAQCFAQIKAQKTEKGMKLEGGLYTPEQLRSTIGEGVAKLDRWSFSETQAVVHFDAYELGAYVEGSYECSFPVEALRAFYRTDSILP